MHFLFRPKPNLFKGDHRFHSANPDGPVVILYAEMGTKEFSRLHQLMLSKANKGMITYVLRHFLAVRSKTAITLVTLIRKLKVYFHLNTNISFMYSVTHAEPQ